MAQVQIVQKEEAENEALGSVLRELTKGEDFVRYDEWTFHGLCIGYRMMRVVSKNLLEVSEYHNCQKDFEDFGEGHEDYEGSWAYVETEDADKVMGISSFADFNKIYASLYECITKQNGWGKTVRCKLDGIWTD